MDKERPKVHLSPEVHPLFSQGTLIHVTELEILEDVLLENGLFSPCQKAMREGKTIPEGTMWHPEDNLYVKFLRLPGIDYLENYLKLIGHFHQFANPEDLLPVGFMVKNDQAVLMFEQHPVWKDSGDYYGIKDSVPSEDIVGVIIYTGIDPENTYGWFDIGPGRITTSLTLEIVRKAEEKQEREIPVLDNFGRKITEQQ